MPILPVITKGDWYFVVKCPGCQLRYAIGPAPSPIDSPVAKAWPEIFDCACGTKTTFQANEIVRLQAKASASSAPNASFH